MKKVINICIMILVFSVIDTKANDNINLTPTVYNYLKIETKAELGDELNCRTVSTKISCRETPITITVCCNYECSNLVMFIAAVIAYVQTEEQVCGVVDIIP